MSRIMILYDNEMPTVEESVQILVRFAEKVNSTVIKCRNIDFKHDKLYDFDVLYCIRCQDPLSFGIMKYASERGKKLFFLLDDDLKDMPKGSFWYPERKKWLLKCISLCDGLVSCNKLILDEYKGFLKSQRTALINTAVDLDSITKPERQSDDTTTKIVMAASDWHTPEFNKMVRPILPALFKKYGNTISLWFIGMHPEFDLRAEYYPQIHFVEEMNLEKYGNYMRSHHFDIGLGIIIPDHFTERKYFNKFIEYTRYGICGIYSNCMPYQLAVKDGYNGYLAENTPENWMKKIDEAISKPVEVQEVLDRAQDYLRVNHSDEKIFEEISRQIPEFVNYRSPEVLNKDCLFLLKSRLQMVRFRLIEMPYLTFKCLKLYGIKEVNRRVKRKFRVIFDK